MQQRVLLVMFLLATLLATACAQSGAVLYRRDLNDDIVAKLAAGQTAQQTTTLLGAPYRRVRFDNLRSTAWDYFYKDTWGYWVEFSVMMNDAENGGRVTGTVSRRIEPDDKN